MGKLEWCRYPAVKKFRRYLYSFWRNSRTWRTHRQTDGRTPGDGNSHAMHSIARQKSQFSRTAAHIFVSPEDAPAIITQYVAWMERQFNACQTPRSMFPSYTMLKSMRKSKNRYFYHILVSRGDAPGAITLNVIWMEREFDAYKLSCCMCPSNYNRFWDTPRYWSKIVNFFIPPCIRRPC